MIVNRITLVFVSSVAINHYVTKEHYSNFLGTFFFSVWSFAIILLRKERFISVTSGERRRGGVWSWGRGVVERGIFYHATGTFSLKGGTKPSVDKQLH